MAADNPPSDDEQSFKSAHSRSPSPSRAHNGPAAAAPAAEERFPPAEESRLLSESSALKAQGNTLFGQAAFSDAISVYDRALSLVPSYIPFDSAVLHSNIAACHIKLCDWPAAVESASRAADALELLDPVPKPVRERPEKSEEGIRLARREKEDQDNRVEEISDETEKAIARLEESGRTLQDVRKLRVKVLMRRARARTEVSGWSALQGADEDYRCVLGPASEGGLSETDRRSAMGALAALGPRLDDAKQREMAEMMGKLKGLGNSLLKPFGLSTENFQFVKDEKSGGYSMNFNQNR
ncbi:hypothetical protein ANO11243_030190 [Dothideomycetidae sp. 11243]|nr:hypothetical protein ANO11243_030190 [fungal sp. No.11243]